MNNIINRGTLAINLTETGALAVISNGNQLPMPYGYGIRAVSDMTGKSDAALGAAAKAKGATHVLGAQVALMAGEADLIAAALASHPANIAKAAAFAAECDRLHNAEVAANVANAWQTDPSFGFAEGRQGSDRGDNTPSHKSDAD